MEKSLETNPIYDAVCRKLKFRPKETRITMTFKADTQQFQTAMQMMEITVGNLTYYIPNAKLDLGDGA